MKIKLLFLLFFVLLNISAEANHLSKIGAAGFDEGVQIAVDFDGSYLLTGTFSGTVDFDPGTAVKELTSKGGLDVFFAKYDENNNYQWAYSFGGSQNDEVSDICLDYLGSFYLAGTFGSQVDFNPGTGTANKTSNGGKDIFLVKFDYLGAFEWVNTIGSPLDDNCSDAAIDILGYVFLTGTFQGTINLNPIIPPDATTIYTSNGGTDIFVLSVSETNEFQWGFGMGSKKDDFAAALQPSSDGGFVLTGAIKDSCDFSPAGDPYILVSNEKNSTKAFIAKYDFYIETEWAYLLDGSLLSSANKSVLLIDGDDNFYVGGVFLGTINFNPKGTLNLTSGGAQPSAFLAKYNISGDNIWAFKIDNAQTSSIAFDTSSNIVIGGVYYGKSDFNPVSGTEYFLTPKSTAGDAYIAKYLNNSNFVWANGFGAVNDGGIEAFTSAAVNYDDYVIATGSFMNKTYFYTANDIDSLTSAGQTDIPIILYKPNGTFDRSSTPIIEKLTVTSPDGGEIWDIGTKHNITWTQQNVSTITIQYRVSNMVPWTTIDASVNALTGTYEWTVPNTPGTYCSVRIFNNSNNTIADTSNANFTIRNPALLKLTSPNGGESWTAGTKQNITWTQQNVQQINIYYRIADAASWISIESNINASDGRYEWTVPATPSNSCLVRIVSSSDNTVADTSNAYFSILYAPAAKLKLIAPIGGEKLIAYNDFDIKWSFDGSDNIDINIYLRISDTSQWNLIGTKNIQVKSFTWNIPEIESKKCKIKIEDALTNGATYSDVSPDYFTIQAEESVTEFQNDKYISINNDNSSLTIKFADDYFPNNINITDFLGKIIYSAGAAADGSGIIEISLESWSNGIYFLSFNIGNKAYFKKILISR